MEEAEPPLGGIDHLPDGVLLRIFEQLPARELLRCQGVCHRWRVLLVGSPGWWRCVHQQTYASEGAVLQPALMPHESPEGALQPPVKAPWRANYFARAFHHRWRRQPVKAIQLLFSTALPAPPAPTPPTALSPLPSSSTASSSSQHNHSLKEYLRAILQPPWLLIPSRSPPQEGYPLVMVNLLGASMRGQCGDLHSQRMQPHWFALPGTRAGEGHASRTPLAMSFPLIAQGVGEQVWVWRHGLQERTLVLEARHRGGVAGVAFEAPEQSAGEAAAALASSGVLLVTCSVRGAAVHVWRLREVGPSLGPAPPSPSGSAPPPPEGEGAPNLAAPAVPGELEVECLWSGSLAGAPAGNAGEGAGWARAGEAAGAPSGEVAALAVWRGVGTAGPPGPGGIAVGTRGGGLMVWEGLARAEGGASEVLTPEGAGLGPVLGVQLAGDVLARDRGDSGRRAPAGPTLVALRGPRAEPSPAPRPAPASPPPFSPPRALPAAATPPATPPPPGTPPPPRNSGSATPPLRVEAGEEKAAREAAEIDAALSRLRLRSSQGTRSPARVVGSPVVVVARPPGGRRGSDPGAFDQGSVEAWRLGAAWGPAPGRPRAPAWEAAVPKALSVCVNGGMAAVTTREGRVLLLDAATGEQVRRVPAPEAGGGVDLPAAAPILNPLPRPAGAGAGAGAGARAGVGAVAGAGLGVGAARVPGPGVAGGGAARAIREHNLEGLIPSHPGARSHLVPNVVSCSAWTSGSATAAPQVLMLTETVFSAAAALCSISASLHFPLPLPAAVGGAAPPACELEAAYPRGGCSATCGCGQAAVLREWAGRGPNQGRLFFSCPRKFIKSARPVAGGAPGRPGSARRGGGRFGPGPGFGAGTGPGGAGEWGLPVPVAPEGLGADDAGVPLPLPQGHCELFAWFD